MAKDKATCQRNHFKRRLHERYNLLISDGEYDYLTARIKKHDNDNNKVKIEYLTKQSNRLSVFLIGYKNIEFVAVYDKFRKTLITSLPIECKNINNIDFYCEELDNE